MSGTRPISALARDRHIAVRPGSRVSLRRARGGSRTNRWPSSQFTMSNSAVFFVPATRSASGFVCPVRPGLARGFGVEAAVTSAAIPAAAIPLHPERGADGAPTGALFSCVARARRDHHAPVRPGPLSALHRGEWGGGGGGGGPGGGGGAAGGGPLPPSFWGGGPGRGGEGGAGGGGGGGGGG